MLIGVSSLRGFYGAGLLSFALAQRAKEIMLIILTLEFPRAFLHAYAISRVILKANGALRVIHALTPVILIRLNAIRVM